MSSQYFENKECIYYPCHDMDKINCLFCFCPLFRRGVCKNKETNLKDYLEFCSKCKFPHEPENYQKIIELLKSIDWEKNGRNNCKCKRKKD